MKILFVVGNNLQENTSANISHNAYIKGLLESGYSVDIIMKSNDNIIIDNSMPKFNTKYYEISGVGLLNKYISLYKKKFEHKEEYSSITNLNSNQSSLENNINSKKKFYSSIRNICRRIYYLYISFVGGAFENHIFWIKKASRIKLDKHYDLVISNSTPNSAHEVVRILLKKNRIYAKHWVQIWEDPWYYDLYGKKSKKVKKAESKLLIAAEKIYYVSPLTLTNQKIFFPKAANKMSVIPLPSMDNNENDKEKDFFCGYFGDYHSNVRNILPFYNTCKNNKIPTVILGNSDFNLSSTLEVKTHGRVSVDTLKQFQEKVKVLVHISNLKGGQIPWKIYHYSNSKHPILVILDGSREERQKIFEHFKKYKRYYFCNNDEVSIYNALNQIKKGLNGIKNEPVKDFMPNQVAKKLILDIFIEKEI